MIKNTKLINFNSYRDPVYGTLVPIEAEQTVPFSVQRIYYIHSVPDGVRRGFHAHIDLEQLMICLHGSVKIHLRTPFEQQEVVLNDPTVGLYVGPMIWREMYDFTNDAVLLVLANKHYDVDDYLRDYTEYEKLAVQYFSTTDNQHNDG